MKLSLVRWMAVSRNTVRRPRRFKTKYSDAWHIGSEVTIKDEGYKAACESRGIRVYKPEEVIRPYLPDMKLSEAEQSEFAKVAPEMKPFEYEDDHPLYQSQPCKTFDYNCVPSLEQAQHLTNTYLMSNESLPDSLEKRVEGLNLDKYAGEDSILEILKESRIFDATQNKLPKNVFVPNIGWNPVIDTMHRPLPYPEPEFSFGRNTRREYGITNTRKSMTFIRNMFMIFDYFGGDYPSLLKRTHLENCSLRQFFFKDGHYIRVTNPLHYVITDDEPLKPHFKDVNLTKRMSLPNIHPESPVARLTNHQVYRNENSFPVLTEANGIKLPQIHTCVEIDASLGPLQYKFDKGGRSLVLAFATALGQARLNYGPDVSGVLKEPITVNLVSTNGVDFLVTVFQLNTLDLDGEVKNLACQEQLGNLFQSCDYAKAVPQVVGYNHEVVKRLLTVYMQNHR